MQTKKPAAVDGDDDLLTGLDQIGAWIKQSKRVAHYWAKTGKIPVTRHGKVVTASKRKISAALKGEA
jgi:hypothetical protein